ncbi:hypothetical protein [Paeniclostridium hominis]|nr:MULTISPECIES: hypothetical protein [Paeniclostridium]
MNNVSDTIDKRIELRQTFTKEFRFTIKEKLKFGIEYMLLIPQ